MGKTTVLEETVATIEGRRPVGNVDSGKGWPLAATGRFGAANGERYAGRALPRQVLWVPPCADALASEIADVRLLAPRPSALRAPSCPAAPR
jgi:hypothetical protein